MKEYRFELKSYPYTACHGVGTQFQALLYLAYLEIGQHEGKYRLTRARHSRKDAFNLKNALIDLINSPENNDNLLQG